MSDERVKVLEAALFDDDLVVGCVQGLHVFVQVIRRGSDGSLVPLPGGKDQVFTDTSAGDMTVALAFDGSLQDGNLHVTLTREYWGKPISPLTFVFEKGEDGYAWRVTKSAERPATRAVGGPASRPN